MTVITTIFPSTFASMKELYTNISIPRETQTHIFTKVNALIEEAKIPGSLASIKSEMKLIDLYRQYRAWISFSEGLNKLWTVVEFYEQIFANGLKLGKFGIGFSNSSTIPALHYANISFLLSYLTVLGVVPVRKRDKEFFLIRQNSSYEAVPRSVYLKNNDIKANPKN